MQATDKISRGMQSLYLPVFYRRARSMNAYVAFLKIMMMVGSDDGIVRERVQHLVYGSSYSWLPPCLFGKWLICFD
jgi:hypothetical protein